MVKKINLNFMLVIAISILLTVFFATFVSYQFFKKEVFSELRAFAKMIEDLDLMEQMKEKGFVKPEEELRITWISQDGSVLYDSYAKDNALNYHGNRPEIAQAAQNGEGSSIRKSQTMERNIFFYAKKCDDGTIIRIAKEAGSIWNVYKNTLPIILLVAVGAFIISIWIARYLTKAFIKPIELIADDMNHLENVAAYKELTPLIQLIRSQHEETVKMARMRQEFTANVSHELKTPLTSISGYSELIANGMASNKEAQHFAEEIRNNAQRLLTLINDILQLSELDDSFEQKNLFDLVDVHELAKRSIEMMEPVAEKHRVTLSLQGAPLVIWGNKELIEELIYNLCDNAIRYNQEGGHVWVTVFEQLKVQDDGIGIPKKHQDRVFERFFRVDKSRSKKTGGTGLGLAIVKHIAEVHKAALSLESEEGVGTAICVKFPNNSSLE